MSESLLVSEIIAKIHENSDVYNVAAIVAPTVNINPSKDQIIRPSTITVEIVNA